MMPPAATYRLQFRQDMTLDRAAELVPYLRRLGISHLYASPLFAAAPGSSHGYDGIDFTLIEPAIGGDGGFARLSDALAAAGLGLLLDFVPNHMAANEANPWWHSVLEHGAASSRAAIFDIDWSAPKILLPILGTAFDDALREGVLGLAFDTDTKNFVFTVYDRRLPLTPQSSHQLRDRLSGAARPDSKSGDGGTNEPAADRDLVRRVHDAQPWQLVHWREGRKRLSYRRFFEITDLICLRVEDGAVFDAVHRRVFELIREGRVAGLRIDHIDGLADPKTYLDRLQEAAGPLYTVVEKILEPGEDLRPDWAVAGTTGYEFIAALAGVFVDRRREGALTRAYEDFIGTREDYASAAFDTKREIFAYNLAAELRWLTDAAADIAAADPALSRLSPEALRDAIVALAAALPIYRSYVSEAGVADADREIIAGARAAAAAHCRAEATGALDFVCRLALLDVEDVLRPAAYRFATRFQQTTGPVMAKAVEDTVFYRYNRLIALNEVGGAPDRFGAPLSDFHAAMAARRARQPAGLTATATHDTKRGEDARARLYVLSEMPGDWAQAVRRWRGLNAAHRAAPGEGDVPEPRTEWLFYQALAGCWPAELMSPEALAGGAAALATLRARMREFMEKAVREAKLRTSWLDPMAEYERAVDRFVDAVLSPETGGGFLDDFVRTCRPVWVAGAVNGLSQLALKLAAPGVPDIYQGCETWDFSLVDPDNRKPVDFALRQSLAESCGTDDTAALLSRWTSGAPKMALTLAGLLARAARPSLFADGDYIPLAIEGPRARHLVAFARTWRDQFLLTIVPRFTSSLLADATIPLVPPESWNATNLRLPQQWRGRAMRNLITRETREASDSFGVRAALSHFPVALFLDS